MLPDELLSIGASGGGVINSWLAVLLCRRDGVIYSSLSSLEAIMNPDRHGERPKIVKKILCKEKKFYEKKKNEIPCFSVDCRFGFVLR